MNAETKTMSGRKGKISDEDILQVIEDHYAPAVGVTDIAEELDVTRQAVYERLNTLHDDGLVEKYKVSRDTVWYLSDAGRRYLEKD
jgi:predicted transcriptional regulator